MTNLSLLSNFYPVIYRRGRKESDELFVVYGRSLWSANQVRKGLIPTTRSLTAVLSFDFLLTVSLVYHRYLLVSPMSSSRCNLSSADHSNARLFADLIALAIVCAMID